jgi:hypothetical protein|tara:strand:- start:648 stop:1271 length:624 start_codon:yes stop_codon:yes gene_type:complete
MQVDSFSKMLFVHIPRTGGSWFGYSWPSHKDNTGEISFIANKFLINRKNGKQIECGRHGTLMGLLKKFKKIDADVSNYKKITIVREPIDRIISSWKWFSIVKDTAKRHGWKTIDDMLDEFEKGRVRANYMPQVDWLCEPGAKFDHIFKFERLLKGPGKVQAVFPKYKPKGKLRRTQPLTISKQQENRIRKLYKDDIDYLKRFYPKLK